MSRPGAVIEGEHDFFVAQEIVRLEVLEPEPRAAPGVDFNCARDPECVWIVALGCCCRCSFLTFLLSLDIRLPLPLSFVCLALCFGLGCRFCLPFLLCSSSRQTLLLRLRPSLCLCLCCQFSLAILFGLESGEPPLLGLLI